MSANRNLRIAVTGTRGIPATWGGVEHHCEEIYSRLAAKGHDITIYARKNYVPSHIKFYKGVKIRYMPTIQNKYLEALIHTFLSIFDIIIKNNFDIIHIHSQGPSIFSFLPRIFRPGIKVFYTCHGLDWRRKKWEGAASKLLYIGEVFSTVFPHMRIVVSKEIQEYYLNQYNVSSYLIPNGINLPKQFPPNFILKNNLTVCNYILFVARLTPEKRCEDIIKAYLKKQRPYELVIVGESLEANYSMAYLKELANNNKSIHFLGYQYNDILNELYANALSFITASELEGLPIALLEAMSHGLPCIASDIAPHIEVLGYDYPFIFPVKNIDKLSDCMDLFENIDKKILEDIKHKSIQKIKSFYNWDNFANMLEELYAK